MTSSVEKLNLSTKSILFNSFNRPVSLVEVVLAINILFSFAKILIGITNNKIIKR